MKEFYLFLGFVPILAAAVLLTAILTRRHEEKRLGEFQDNILKKQENMTCSEIHQSREQTQPE